MTKRKPSPSSTPAAEDQQKQQPSPDTPPKPEDASGEYSTASMYRFAALFFGIPLILIIVLSLLSH